MNGAAFTENDGLLQAGIRKPVAFEMPQTALISRVRALTRRSRARS
jgi:hypothetical protein